MAEARSPAARDGRRARCRAFCLKYFCEGQLLDKKLSAKLEASDKELPWTIKYRKQIAMAIPLVFVHVIWWTAMVRWNSFHLFTDQVGKQPQYRKLCHSGVRPWYMSVTMIFGSMIAGATSEGGAAVAFPVMTLAMDVRPDVAKQFSFMIQSVGMTAAAFVILFMGVQVEWKSICYCTAGGIFGLIYGLEKVAPVLTPPYAKMYFVCIWGSFAASLYHLNRLRDRRVYVEMDPPHLPRVWRNADLVDSPYLSWILNWKALVLVAAGFLGGIFTSISGSGIDICSFAVLTLLFRISEKTATPTSVVLMAINTVVALCYSKWLTREGLERLAWEFFVVCCPIVVIGAPLGSIIGSHLHRLTLAVGIYSIDFTQFVGALVVVRPWSHEKCHKRGPRVQHPGGRWRGSNCEPLHLCWTSAALFAGGLGAFWLMQFFGQRLMDRNDTIEIDAKSRKHARDATLDPDANVELVSEDAVASDARAQTGARTPTGAARAAAADAP
ncbi:sulfite exporter TauE/SafE-domain-containing protein [Pelagophyceae sp. CCMP2097]|nr:sulfite exporter TauE/SafE-domain-containing protein [Pelagophyceae sp. CCMP2097]